MHLVEIDPQVAIHIHADLKVPKVSLSNKLLPHTIKNLHHLSMFYRQLREVIPNIHKPRRHLIIRANKLHLTPTTYPTHYCYRSKILLKHLNDTTMATEVAVELDCRLLGVVVD